MPRVQPGFHTDSARTGAPHAIQVADRLHLWQNLGTAVEGGVRLHTNCLKAAFTSPDHRLSNATKSMPPIEARIRERHATCRQHCQTTAACSPA
ncbi:hypothetical protein ACFWAP_11025 [Streptomyces goshikiensis]|uniref:hypothetical protein n=1 Tax=Streptomyces goshikiensis TaxID=1942 RepID=UPI0036635A9D